MLSPHELIAALTALPAREFAEVVSVALEKRDSGPMRQHGDDALLRITRRPDDAGETPTMQELLAQTRRQVAGGVTIKGVSPSPLERCCGLTFTSRAKKVVCPLCGKLVEFN